MSVKQLIKPSHDGKERYLFFYGNETIFSNFYLSDLIVDGLKFNCGEQYFQYKKAETFGDTEMGEKIMKADKPGSQKGLGRKVSNFDADRWTALSPQVMKEGLMAKFKQNEELKQRLLETNDMVLVEANPRDRIWGIGMDMSNPDAIDKKKWKGTNLLGNILMEVRQELLA